MKSIIELLLNIAYLYLAYMSYKSILVFKENQERSKKEWSKEVKLIKNKLNDEQQRILLKWLTSIIYFKIQWLIDYLSIFFLPVNLIKFAIGLWILLPQFYGELFFFHLISDKLETLESYIRKIRNQLATRVIVNQLQLTEYLFINFRLYMHTDKLRNSAEQILHIQQLIDQDLNQRKKVSSNRLESTKVNYSSNRSLQSHKSDQYQNAQEESRKTITQQKPKVEQSSLNQKPQVRVIKRQQDHRMNETLLEPQMTEFIDEQDLLQQKMMSMSFIQSEKPFDIATQSTQQSSKKEQTRNQNFNHKMLNRNTVNKQNKLNMDYLNQESRFSQKK